ncbi:MAG: dioxygenase [Sulfobacillus acidophilus]|uniref:Dioxygenase n=1 Tax=Sulfobacillus acidophilus TaxID=53633 RepID=A0A2T2WDC6_9FIRM|nr:MAG: dioxygenase [Sulfobacillus acidophilus]
MLPTVFLAHGSPMLAVENNAYTEAIGQLASSLPRPRGIVVFSGHYETIVPTVNETQRYEMIYDFYGFPDDLYRIQYPAVGDAHLAQRIERLLHSQSISYEVERGRGLDHGAWVILRLLYPKADIPVVTMSVTPGLLPREQYRLGQALADLRADDVLIVGSGGTVHNLRAIMWESDAVANWAESFDRWLEPVLKKWDLDALFDFRQQAPGADLAVPRRGEEHFIPLLYAMGAADRTRHAKRLHLSYRYGTLSHSIWLFE